MAAQGKPGWRWTKAIVAIAATCLLLSCGGGGEEPAALRVPPHAAAAAPTPTASQLMDWAQTAYPLLFPGPQADNFSVPPYVYRYYPQTRNYLGVSDGTIYVMGPATGGPLTPVGTLGQFACNVFPDSCGTVLTSVTAHLSSPTSITAELLNGGYMPNAYLSGYVTGDVAALNGKTLYLFVEDPYGLFERGTLYPFRSGTSVSATLYGVKQTIGGSKVGNLKIHACLDTQCATRLAGSPLTIPFNVNVGDGVTLDTYSVEVTAPAYQTPTSASVQVTMPRYVQSWSTRLEPAVNMTGAIFVPSAVSSGPTAPTGTVVVNMRAMAPGTYTQTVRVLAATLMPNGQSQTVYSDFVMKLVSTGAFVPAYTVTPAQINVTRHYGSQGFEATSFNYTTNRAGVSMGFAGIGAYTYPPAAEGYTQRRSWWSNANPSTGNQYGTRICSTFVGDTHACLPVGTYTAVMSYDVYEGLSYSRIEVPVTLNVIP
ncbi:MAG: putative lipoprotein [Ramlibacter sp.]|nr:putative lipoprotein [Ramlibacter sp.]